MECFMAALGEDRKGRADAPVTLRVTHSVSPKPSGPPRSKPLVAKKLSVPPAVHRRHQGSVSGQLFHDFRPDRFEDLLKGETPLGEHPVVGAPVLELAPAGAHQAGHGAAAQADQRTQGEPSPSVTHPFLFEALPGPLPEEIEVFEEARRFFLIAEGGGFFLLSTS